MGHYVSFLPKPNAFGWNALKAENQVTVLNSWKFCLLPSVMCGGFLTACTQNVFKQKQLALCCSASSNSPAMIFPYCSSLLCSDGVWNLIYSLLFPCSISKPFPASCPHFLAHPGLQLHPGAAGTSEEANMDIISKGGTVEIKWSAGSRCFWQKMLQTDAEKTQRKNVAVFTFWHLCFSASQWDLSCKLLKRK